MTSASPETRQQRRHMARMERKHMHSAPPQKNPYRRALEAFKMRAEAFKAASIMAPLQAKLALMVLAQRLGTYRSRGKGRGTPSRRYGNLAGKYKPHQGAREMERRRIGGFYNERASEAMYRGSLRDAVFA